MQAALSSASLLHSRSQHAESSAAGAAANAASSSSSGRKEGGGSTLNYHIPTPDATGLIENGDYAKLYQTHRYVEPHAHIRFSDTVEESSGGWGGLGYCMDDDDVEWLTAFNAGKGESSSNGSAAASGGASGNADVSVKAETPAPSSSPKREKENIPLSSGPRERRNKGKDRDKADKDGNAGPGASGKQDVSSISEDVFEYVMGVMEKYTEDTVPTLHTVSWTNKLRI